MASKTTLRDYLRQRAGWVWNEQRHAFDQGLSLQEETLTEMLLLRMAKDHGKHGLTVKMFNKNEEGKNGADWEWIIRTATCDVGLRVQAKRLYHKDTNKEYGGLDPKSPQAGKLIAKAAGCIPIYVFFNHEYGKQSSLFASGEEPPYRGRSYWGCSVASAHKVKNEGTNDLGKLKKLMKPWHHLLTPAGACGANSALSITPADRARSMPQSRRELFERIEDRQFMDGYLDRSDLDGVAIIDFSDFRG